MSEQIHVTLPGGFINYDCYECLGKARAEMTMTEGMVRGLYAQFIVCPVCGNKRCPKASQHDNACSRSNEPGQEGSIFQ